MTTTINADDGVISGSAGLKSTPDSSGELALQTNGVTKANITPAGLFQFDSGYGSVATAYGCRAWVNFDGTGTVDIRASGNVSSVTDVGVGVYNINFTTNMPDVNYSVVASRSNDGYATRVDTYFVGQVRIVTFSGTALADSAAVGAAIFR